MSLPAFLSGKDGKVTFGAGPTTLAVTKWSLKPGAKVLELPNTSDGMRRIAGLVDAEGSVELHVDTAQSVETDLVGGSIVAMKLYTNASHFWSLTAIIDAPSFSSDVEGTYDLSFDFKMSSGTCTFT